MSLKVMQETTTLYLFKENFLTHSFFLNEKSYGFKYHEMYLNIKTRFVSFNKKISACKFNNMKRKLYL